MPINTAIYADRVQPDVGNALQAYAAMKQVQAGKTANQLQQYQLQKAQDEDASSKALRDAYSANLNPDGTINYGGVSSSLIKSGAGDLIPSIAKQQREDQTARLDYMGRILKTQGDLAKGVMAAPTLQNAMASLDQMEQITGKGTMDAERQALAKIGDNPDGLKAWAAGHALTADALMPKIGSRDLGGMVQTTMIDPLTGKVTVSDSAQKTMSQTDAANLALKKQDLALSQQKLSNDIRNQATNVDLKKQELAIQQQKQANDNADRANAKQGAVASYDTAISTLDRLASHPGKSAVVGAPNPLQGGFGFATVRGTPAADFSAELETFKSQTFLPMVQNLRGMGALSDAEGKKLSAAVGALDPRMGEDAFNASIGRIRSDLEAAKNRALSSMGQPQAKTGIAHPADIGDLLKKYGAK